MVPSLVCELNNFLNPLVVKRFGALKRRFFRLNAYRTIFTIYRFTPNLFLLTLYIFTLLHNFALPHNVTENIMNKFFYLCVNGLLMLLLASCSGNFTGRANIDTQNFRDYFAPSKVEIYQSIDEFTGKYKYLGLVDGEDCQSKAHLAKPDNVIARTQARTKAYQLKANAIIFTGCALLSEDGSSIENINTKSINKNHVNAENTPKQCIASTVCYGQAYYVEPTSLKN